VRLSKTKDKPHAKCAKLTKTAQQMIRKKSLLPFQTLRSLREVLLPGVLVFSLGCFCLPAWADDADVYLFAGQSNMWGTGNQKADVPPDLVGPHEDVLIFRSVPSVPKEGWYPLENGKNNNYSGGAWGSEAKLMPLLAAVAKNKPLYVFKVSAGGSALAKKEKESDWNVASTGELLDGFVTGIGKVSASLEALEKTPRFRGLIWMQGESECCHSQAEAESYQKELEALIARVREATGTPELPVYVGRIHRHYKQPHLQIVRANQARVAAADKHVFLFDTDDSPLHTDSIHFNPAGQIKNGQILFDLITGKAGQKPAGIVPGQTFSIREFSGPGTPVGTLALSEPGSPSPTFMVEGDALEINGITGAIRVRDLSGVKSSGDLKVAVSAINGVAPTATGTITVKFEKAADDKIVGVYAAIDPADSGGSLVTDGAYEEVYDPAAADRKYVAPDAKKRPLQATFPGTTKNALRFDGTKVMTGPVSSEFLKPGADEDFTIAAAVHIPEHSVTTTGWCLIINKGVTPTLGFGYDYAENKFFFVYANPFNGALQTVGSSIPIQPGTSHVVRMRKVAETCRLYINGVLAGENQGKARTAILAPGDGAPIGMGGAFPPAPSFTGSLGKFYLVKGIPTTKEEARMDRDLAEWGGIKIPQ